MPTSVLAQSFISGPEKFFSRAREFIFETRLNRESLTSLVLIQVPLAQLQKHCGVGHCLNFCIACCPLVFFHFLYIYFFCHQLLVLYFLVDFGTLKECLV